MAACSSDFFKKWICKGDFLSADDFLSLCRKQSWYRVPGCYIILVFRGKHQARNLSNYSKGYVGQSVDIYNRVRDHVSGRGNKSIYEEYASGKTLLIQIVPSSEESLNDLECKLIGSLDRSRLYNKTDGGSAVRCRDKSEFILPDRRLLLPWTRGCGRMNRITFQFPEKGTTKLKINGILIGKFRQGSKISFDISDGEYRFKVSASGKKSFRKTRYISSRKEFLVSRGIISTSVIAVRRK